MRRSFEDPRGTALAIAVVAIPASCVLPTSTASPAAHAALKLLALAVLASIVVCSRGQRRRWHPVELALAAFAGEAILSTLATGSGLAAGAGVWLPAVCFVLVVRGARVCLADREAAVQLGVACAAVVVAGLAISELVGVHLPWAPTRRPASTFGNRNHVASYLLLCLPTLFAAALQRRRWALPVITAVVLVIVASRCRSVYVAGVIIGALALVLTRRREGLRRPCLAIALGVCLGVAPWPGVHFGPSVADAATRMLSYDAGSGLARLQQHHLGLSSLEREPLHVLAGFGAGTWERIASEGAHAEGGLVPRFSGAVTPNSDLLRVVVEQGVLGLGLLAFAFLVALRAQRRVASLVTLTAAAICAAFDPVIVRPECVALLGVLIGAASPATEPSGRARWLFMVICAIACGTALLRAASFCGIADELYDRPGASERRAVVLAQQGHCADADHALDHFIAARPFHWGARVEVAHCFERVGDRTEALRVWRAAFAIEPHLRELVTATRKGS